MVVNAGVVDVVLIVVVVVVVVTLEGKVDWLN